MSDFAIILAAALAGGLVAYRLKLPVLLGYLAAGIIVSPNAFRLVQDLGLVQTLADIGVVLLMFTLGMEFSVRDLKRVGTIGLGGGTAQVLATACLGFIVGIALFRWSTADALFFGFLISLSSTMIVLKMLVERGETGTVHGRIMIAILLVQDLAVLPLMVILPAVGQSAGNVVSALATALLEAAVFFGAVTAIGSWAIPALLGRSAGLRSRELFMVTILAVSLGAAFAASYFGMSAAFGAFAAGMLVSRSHFAHQALADVVPFRNVFAALFFVSLGMLASPRFVADNLGAVIAVALVIVIAKFTICASIARYFRHSTKTVLLVGAGLTQVGEFSFVLGRVGLEAGVMSAYLYHLVLASAILTMLLTPAGFKLANLAYGKLCASPRLARYMRLGSDGALVEAEPTLTNHVIVCGHGRAGSNLASTLGRYEIPYVVVELNPRIVSELRAGGIPCVYGDAGSTHILEAANIGKARVLALTCPDPLAEITATAYAKSVNPGIDVIARLPDEAVDGRLRAAGTSEVVEPAFEASLEFVRHILRYYGVSGPEVENLVCPFLREHRSEEAEQLPKS